MGIAAATVRPPCRQRTGRRAIAMRLPRPVVSGTLELRCADTAMASDPLIVRIIGGSVATKLEKPLKRELAIGDAAYMLTITPEGLKLVPKGRRNGLDLTWKSILEGQVGAAPAGGDEPGT